MGREPPNLQDEDWEQVDFEHFGMPPEDVYREGDYIPEQEEYVLSGNGLYNYTKKAITSAYNTTKDVAHKIYTGDTGMPPNVQKILDKYGNYKIKYIDIVRNPVSDVLTSALSAVSWGEFGRNLKNSPYDKLFHLKIILTLSNGVRVGMEKVERVKLSIDPRAEKVQDVVPASLNGQKLTLNELYYNAFNYMGYDKFYSYSSKNNNCQHFILSVLKANGIGNAPEYEFIKQSTEELFGDETFLRKMSNTVTDIGARFNVLTQGGNIYI